MSDQIIFRLRAHERLSKLISDEIKVAEIEGKDLRNAITELHLVQNENDLADFNDSFCSSISSLACVKEKLQSLEYEAATIAEYRSLLHEFERFQFDFIFDFFRRGGK